VAPRKYLTPAEAETLITTARIADTAALSGKVNYQERV
jgi:hypothetical protein